jgi:hypothetical protein
MSVLCYLLLTSVCPTQSTKVVSTLTFIANYMHLADNLVILDNNGAQTYSGPAAPWISNHDDLAKSQDDELPSKSSATPNPEAFEGDSFQQVLKPVAEDDPETIKRQQGDVGVWKYYGKSIGALAILFFTACICINVFANNFQSRLSEITFHGYHHLLFHRTMVAVEYRNLQSLLREVSRPLRNVCGHWLLLPAWNTWSGAAQNGSKISGISAPGPRQSYSEGSNVVFRGCGLECSSQSHFAGYDACRFCVTHLGIHGLLT